MKNLYKGEYMREVSASNFISYKNGFIEARDRIIKNYRMGREISFEEQEGEDIWYSYGYRDGFVYYSSIEENNKIDFDEINTIDEIQKCFSRRITVLNEDQEKDISIAHSLR